MSRVLENKVALVTGGSRGIGAAIAKRLAADGAAVAITYSSSPAKADEVVAAITKGGGKAAALKADAADAGAVQKAVADAAAKFGGKLDILVNNSGIWAQGVVPDHALEDWDRVMNVNVRSLFVAATAAVKVMPDGGRIINIGSCLGEHVGMPGISAYATSKAAVIGLTKSLARDLGPRKITVNNVEPGPIDTDMNPADGAHADSQRALLALGRYGTTEELASAVAYLASPGAAFVTGASLLVDGGFAA